jgi:hypothetical protein
VEQLPIIEAPARDHKPLDVLEISLATAMDFITAYLFGLHNSSRFLQDEGTRKRWLDVHQRTKGHSFWPLEFPHLTSFLSKLGINLVDPRAVSAGDEVKDLCLQMLKNIDSSLGFPWTKSPLILQHAETNRTKPVVFEQLVRYLYPSNKEAPSSPSLESIVEFRLKTASEMMDNMVAGTETTGWMLTYLFYELSKHHDLQSALRSELLSISPLLK